MEKPVHTACSNSRIMTSSIDNSKHSFAIKPYIPGKKRGLTPSSNSTSRIVNKSEQPKINNGSKSLRSKRHLESSRNKQKIPQFIQTKNQLMRVQNELKNLKKQHKKLKLSHLNCEEKQNEKNAENKKLNQQILELRQQSGFYQQQFERIKKESLKLLQIQGFKNKKMQQTLQQKQLMIHFLKNQLNKNQEPSNFTTNCTIFQNQILNPTQHYKPSSFHNSSNLSLASLEDILVIQAAQKDRFINSISQKDESSLSLNFSKDKSKYSSKQEIRQSQKRCDLIQNVSAQCFQNISFSINYNQQDNIFKKKRALQITVQNIPLIQESQSQKRKGNTSSRTKRRKSETDEKSIYQKNMRAKYQNLQSKRLCSSIIR